MIFLLLFSILYLYLMFSYSNTNIRLYINRIPSLLSPFIHRQLIGHQHRFGTRAIALVCVTLITHIAFQRTFNTDISNSSTPKLPSMTEESKSAASSSFSSSFSSSSSSSSSSAESVSPLSILLFGATGRTGVLFIPQALERGHTIYAYVRNQAKIDKSLSSHPKFHLIEGELDNVKLIQESIIKSKPNLIYGMLSSDPSPHTAVSTCTKSVIQALTTLKEEGTLSTSDLSRIYWLIIAGFGVGVSKPYAGKTFADRALLGLGSWMYSSPLKDFEYNFGLMEEAEKQLGLQTTILLPPLLTNSPLTKKYIWGSLEDMGDKMHSYNTVSRADMAHLALELGEKFGKGEKLPKYIPLKSG